MLLGLDSDYRTFVLARYSCFDHPPDPDAAGGGGDPGDDDDDLDALDVTDGDLEDVLDPDAAPTGPQSRFKSQQEAEEAYRQLQADRDKKVTNLEQQVQALTAQAQQPPSSRSTPQDDAAARNEAFLEQKAAEMARDVATLDPKDPQFNQKYYKIQLKHHNSVQMGLAKAVTQQELGEREQLEREIETARTELRTNLTEAGLEDPGYLDLALWQLDLLGKKDPNWAQRVPVDQQIPQLVQMVKDSGFVPVAVKNIDNKNKRQTGAQDAFKGTISKSGRGPTGGQPGGGEGGVREEGPGSMIKDLKRNRARMQKKGSLKLKAVGVIDEE